MKGRKKNVWIMVSPVQREIATLLSEGLTASEIAAKRERSKNTIRSMIRAMLNRYDVKNATQLVAEFIRRKIIQ